jgi:branched-chain amino acid transport system ATP-binding protein
MASKETILQTKELSKDFGALIAVNRVNLDVGVGVHSIIGPNGAGKTTLFNLLTGFLKPSRGEVFYQGRKITGLQPYRISQMGMARSFQITSIFPELTVYENVRIAAQSRLKARYNIFTSFEKLKGVHEKTQSVIKQVGLTELADLKAKNLSYGFQRGLDIGISLATEPNLILLDEPTSGMDREDTKLVIQLISVISKKMPVILIEHNIDIVLSISDRITVLHQGTVLAEGTPLEIQKNDKVQEAYLGGY